MINPENEKKYDEFVSNIKDKSLKNIYLRPDIREMLLTRKEGDPDNILLCGWNKGKYEKKDIPCPRCESLDLVYEDKWVPNYLDYDSCVCRSCLIEFHFTKSTSDELITYDSIKDLTIINNLYMTTEDLWQEQFYDKNGRYYLQISG
jgi:hypothetical protein